ncbi:amino acid adenylation domain-containing protein [Pelomicrobium sp. G1]|uniref:amino acid adenylation domain-containing protein n=1 Tax=unclassified Pelomicrobium TaxID=2815318 RepID=UPI003F757B8F
METPCVLHDAFIRAAERYPERIAAVEPGAGEITYRELAALSDRVRDRLRTLGVQPGDRVGIYLRKSIDAVAAIYGILKAGAAYVPVDPGAPPSRNAYILHDCAVRAVVLERRFQEKLEAELAQLGAVPSSFVLEGAGGGAALARALEQADAANPAPLTTTAMPGPGDLAYILYTSGSTGKPKGVMLSHENGVSFVDWCSEVFEPRATDRFSSHAPFHFDLSILDIHVALKHGAALVLVAEDAGKDPLRLAPLIAEQRISVWYSAPSILSLLAQYGSLSSHDYSALRLVLFAGEVFPVKHLRTLTRWWPHPRYFNLYGPTETNVCTFYEVPLPIPEERTAPFPIGRVCSHLRSKVVDGEGREVQQGEEGELCISGRGVMQGYWALPERTAAAFLTDGDGVRWYKTGDIVVEGNDGNYVYLGRRDRMVKRRGYRVELGEIEAGLYRHPLVKEAAVVALPDEEAGVKIKAFLSCRESKRPSLIELKRFCSEVLPAYMIPDHFVWCEALPKTSTDKVDYQRLKEMV